MSLKNSWYKRSPGLISYEKNYLVTVDYWEVCAYMCAFLQKQPRCSENVHLYFHASMGDCSLCVFLPKAYKLFVSVSKWWGVCMSVSLLCVQAYEEFLCECICHPDSPFPTPHMLHLPKLLFPLFPASFWQICVSRKPLRSEQHLLLLRSMVQSGVLGHTHIHTLGAELCCISYRKTKTQSDMKACLRSPSHVLHVEFALVWVYYFV